MCHRRFSSRVSEMKTFCSFLKFNDPHPRLLVSLCVLSALVQCAPREAPDESPDELRAQLESARKERDSLMEKLDASTRERVDLDGEVNRLRKELEELKKTQSESDPAEG